MTVGPQQGTNESRAERGAYQVSTRALLLLLIILAVFLYAVRWILLPFAISSVAAYLCAPLLDFLASRTRLPRTLFAIAMFVVLLAAGAGIACLGMPLLVREATAVVTDLDGMIQRLVQGTLGDRQVELLGKSTDASEIAQAAVTAVRDWIGQAGVLLTIAGVSFAGIFGAFLTLVLLFYSCRTARDLLKGYSGSYPRSIGRCASASGLGSIRLSGATSSV